MKQNFLSIIIAVSIIVGFNTYEFMSLQSIVDNTSKKATVTKTAPIDVPNLPTVQVNDTNRQLDSFIADTSSIEQAKEKGYIGKADPMSPLFVTNKQLLLHAKEVCKKKGYKISDEDLLKIVQSDLLSVSSNYKDEIKALDTVLASANKALQQEEKTEPNREDIKQQQDLQELLIESDNPNKQNEEPQSTFSQTQTPASQE